nr:integrase, catalytic region, zinc finger, CCHC-type, peptidase aspartic, catalytic [Tanacetum cinerariifolium]
ALRQKFKKSEQERDELKLKLEKFQTSSKNLSQLLASQTNDTTGLGYDNQVFNSSVFHYDEMFSSQSDVSFPASPVYDRYKSGERYHAAPPSYTGTFMPLKPDLVFHDAPTINETVHTAFNVKLSPTKPDKDFSHSHRPVCFGNNDFVVIAGYGYVVIGSMTIKKVYYVEGLGHNLFSIGQFLTRASKSPFKSLHALFETKMV